MILPQSPAGSSNPPYQYQTYHLTHSRGLFSFPLEEIPVLKNSFMTATPPTFLFIMAGGSGERFWPLSRQKTPKHLLRLFSEKTLLEETLLRLEGIVPIENIFILTSIAQRDEILRTLPHLQPQQIIAEPAKRDTAPATALATAIGFRNHPDAVIGLLPADALIRNHAVFQKETRDVIACAAHSKSFVTFAIPPTHPATGFGYLEYGAPLESGTEGTTFVKLQRFVEKPDQTKAQEYFDSGRFGWNAGIFFWRASLFKEECQRLAPELAQFIQAFPQGDFSAFLTEQFPKLPKISVDYAIMEKATSVIAARATFDWDDVGSWSALPPHLGQDPQGNTFHGSVVSLESKNTIVHSSSRTVALYGVQDLVVVETPDAVLICHRDQVQQIKNLLPKLPPELH